MKLMQSELFEKLSHCHTMQVFVLFFFLLYHYMASCCKSVGVMGHFGFIV